MDLSLRERLAQLGPIRPVDRVSSGSPATIALRLPSGRAVAKTVDGAVTLARRGLSLAVAKRAMEELLVARHVFVTLPMVEKRDALTAELAVSGIAAAPVDPSSAPDVPWVQAYARPEGYSPFALPSILRPCGIGASGRREPD